MAGQYRNWCFTLNNPDEVLEAARWPQLRCAVWQLEMGEEGTEHYQGYLEFTAAKRLGGVRALDGLERAHFEPRRGTKQQAVDYCCKKDGTELEGPWWWPDEATVRGGGAQGKRTDLEGALDAVKSGASNAELIEDHGVVAVKFHRGLEWARLNLPQPEWQPAVRDCVCYWGPTGTGKSWTLRQECPEGPDWFWASPGKWFDGYQGQPGIVFDEIRDSWYPWEFLLRLIDVYPKTVEIKGGTVRCVATRFRMSTNVHPKGWYKGAKGKPNHPWQDSPLRRRFSRIVLMDQPVNVPGVMDVDDEDEPDSDPELPLVPDERRVLWDPRN